MMYNYDSCTLRKSHQQRVVMHSSHLDVISKRQTFTMSSRAAM